MRNKNFFDVEVFIVCGDCAGDEIFPETTTLTTEGRCAWKQLYEAYGIRERRPELERLSGVDDREVKPAKKGKGKVKIFSFDEIYDYDDIIRIAKRNKMFVTDALEDKIPNVTVARTEDGDPLWQFEADANEVFKLTFEDEDAEAV